MIRVWTAEQRSGVIAQLKSSGSTFAYEIATPPTSPVSMTMPVRVQSWDTPRGLAPIFDMNLPEGALREYLLRRFAKATGQFDDLELLAVVGRSQIGRVRYTGLDEQLQQDMPFQSIDEILTAKRDGGLFQHLLERFATYSGVSGVQPKVLIRSRDDKLSGADGRRSTTVQSATHIVKLWHEGEYPQLAANEFFCLEAARRLGLPVPRYDLSTDGGALVVERFDVLGDSYLGFEDFCVLNGLQAREKYKGGYETRLWGRLRDYVKADDFSLQAEQLFQLFVLNCAVRNGDAHLKNFGLLYDTVDGPARLAPVYDIVTTTAYLAADKMALTLDGSTNWPVRSRLTHLGQSRAGLTAKRIREILSAVADAVADTRGELLSYFANVDRDLGARIAAAWDNGCRDIA